MVGAMMETLDIFAKLVAGTCTPEEANEMFKKMKEERSIK